jgi:iron complex transport system substrate-binding protein
VTGYERYVPISAEAAVAAAPDVILTVTRTLDDIGGIDALLAQPGLAQTPAGQARAVVAMDDLYLLGFGPRLGEAVRDLALQLHPELAQR